MALKKVQGGVEVGGQAPQELRGCPTALLKVTASWCGPCKQIHPGFLSTCEKYATIQAYILDIDEANQEGGDAQQLLEVLDISALPTFVAFHAGQEIGRLKGASVDDMERLFATLKTSAEAAIPGPPPTEIADANKCAET